MKKKLENSRNITHKRKKIMEIVENYSDKSFVVKGESTKTYSNELKNLGGRFNRNLSVGAGWVFPNKNKDAVTEFVNKANSGQVDKTVPSLPSSSNGNTNVGEGGLNIPTVPQQVAEQNYQVVKFKIFKPKEGMKVTLKVNGSVMEGVAKKVETHDNVTDTVYVDFSGKTSLAVICRGKWQIFGLFDDHTLFFS